MASPPGNPSDSAPEALLHAIASLLPPLLTALDGLEAISRRLHPPQLESVIYQALPVVEPLKDAVRGLDGASWPEHLRPFRARLEAAAESACAAYDGLEVAVTAPNGVIQAYRSLRHHVRALDTLYPIAQLLPAVSQFFLDPERRDEPALLERLEGADHSRPNVSLIHASNERKERGGFSVYVPEYYDSRESYPLVVALHGGSGHGADFLWSWLRDARTCATILVSPTAIGDTWALMGPDVDSENLDAMLKYVGERWNVDRSRMLLTGMSDGGTFSYLSGLRSESPFTHLAPCSAAFHPLLLDGFSAERLQGLPIYLIHGALDWMFPVDIARTANATLRAAGAQVVYREIEDLSHTYPRDENPRILRWFLGQTDAAN